MASKHPTNARLMQLSDREIIVTLKRHNTVTQAADKFGVGRGTLRDRCTSFNITPGLAGAYADLRLRGIAYRAKARAGKAPHVQKQNGKPIEIEAEESAPKERSKNVVRVAPGTNVQIVSKKSMDRKEDDFVDNLIKVIGIVKLSDKARVKLAKVLMG